MRPAPVVFCVPRMFVIACLPTNSFIVTWRIR